MQSKTHDQYGAMRGLLEEIQHKAEQSSSSRKRGVENWLAKMLRETEEMEIGPKSSRSLSRSFIWPRREPKMQKQQGTRFIARVAVQCRRSNSTG